MKDLSREMCELFVLYDRFFQETASGLHGVTAKFWITFVELLHLYREFSRSIVVILICIRLSSKGI